MQTVLESLNSALLKAFSEREDVYLLGEDILDPYGGAFKVTRGISTKYPNRVLTAPISEAGMVGLATGMALRGMHVVVEIMFGDFIALIADQVVNHIAKFRWMFNNQVHLPLVIRTPMGGRRGYGPTHSQSIEKLFMGIPGLQMISPVGLCLDDGTGSPGDLLKQAIQNNFDPLIFIENKLQYLLPVQSESDLNDFWVSAYPYVRDSKFPSYCLEIKGAPPATVTIAAYGYMAELARQAVSRLAFEYEIFTELVIPTQLTPFDIRPILESAQKTGMLIVAEEGNLSLGWGAEIIARVAQETTSRTIKYHRVASLDVPIPASAPLEALVLPDVDRIIQSALQFQHAYSTSK